MSFSDLLKASKIIGEEEQLRDTIFGIMEKNHIIPQGATENFLKVIEYMKKEDELYWLEPNAKLQVKKYYTNH